MQCPICRADNPHSARVCSACGSNLSTRGGADIVMRSDGTADHAGNSRWKAGAGTAGAGLLAGLAKFGALPYLALKAFLIFRLVHLATLGGAATILGIVAIVVLIGGSLLRTGRRLHL